MARALQRYEQGTRELVGLAQNGRRALYCNTEARTLVSVAFDKHGVYAVEDTLSRNVRDAEAWIDVYGDDLEWVHPRYGSDTNPKIADTFRYRKRGVQKANATHRAE
jgi:hypothetical protein